MYRFSLFRKIFCFAALIILIVSTLSPSYADEVKKSPIKVGFFELDGFNDVDQDGNLSGYGYEYLMEISKYTGWKYNFISYTEDKNGKHRLTYYEALDLLKQGKIDIMGSMRKTPERSDLYLYPIFPYNINYSCLSAASDNTKYTCSDFSSLDGVVIGTFRGSSRDDEIKAFLKENGVKNYSLKAYDTMKQLKEALLKTHTIDLIYANNFRSIENERVLVRLNPSPYYFAMSKNNKENLDALSSAVEQIEVNRPLFSKKLLTKYFQDSYSSQLTLSPEELQYIKSNPVVRVAYDPYFAPFEYYDKASGRVCGISADLLKLISKQTGLKFSYAPTTSYDSALKNAKKNHIQLIATFGSDYKWAEKHHSRLTTSYLDLPVSAIYNKKVKNYNDKSLSVAVEKGYFLTEKLKREKLYTHYIYYDTLEECINAVDKGDADITFASTYSADYFLSHSYYSNLKMFTTYDLNYEISLAVTNTSDDLLYSIINKSLANIPRRSFDDIFYKNILFYKENASLSDYITLHPYEFMAAGSILGALLLAGLVSLRTAKHNAKQEKYLNDERINLALMHTNISLWDYDFKNKLLIQPSGSKKIFGPDQLIYGVPEVLVDTGYVHENSKDSFCQLFYKIQGSESIVSGVFQIRLADSKVEYEDYIWMRITLTKVFDENSVPIRVLGVSEDITEEMSFKEKATKDSLTNLLNRAAFRQYTMQYLAEHMDDESGAMFLIDIDNFKHVNDQHGHVSGDELLLNIANILTSHFRSEDLICRLGGDEFTVFMKHVHDIEEVRKKAKLLSEALIFNSDKLFSTCSIGIVMKKVNSTYEDLYWYADRAMYQAKQQGKNQWYLIP